MSRACLICLRPLGEEGEHHPACLKRLFATKSVPRIELDPSQAHLVGGQMAGRVSISGVQKKISLGWGSAERKTLRATANSAAFILKPTSSTFPGLPENEHLCLTLARAAGLETPEAGLVRLSDQSLALIVKRFDRTPDGQRLPMEDFCQLAQKPPAQKYHGSAELFAKLIGRYSDAPLLDLRALFTQLVFAWLTGNGDLHLKNLSLLSAIPNTPRLSPAYDLVNTALYMPFEFALPLGGKQRKLRAGDWLRFAERLGLSARIVTRDMRVLIDSIPAMLLAIHASPLPDHQKLPFVERLQSELDLLLELHARAQRKAGTKTRRREAPVLGAAHVHEQIQELMDLLQDLGIETKGTPLESDLLDLARGLGGSLNPDSVKAPASTVRRLREFLQVQELVQALRAAPHLVGSELCTRHLKGLRLSRSDHAAEAARDHLFELQVASRLAKKHWKILFAEPDLRIVDQAGDELMVACKRPRSPRGVKRAVRMGAVQIARAKGRGFIVIDLSLMLGPWVLCDSPEERREASHQALAKLIEREAVDASIQRALAGGRQLSEASLAPLGVICVASLLAVAESKGKSPWVGTSFASMSFSNPKQASLAPMLSFIEDCLAVRGD